MNISIETKGCFVGLSLGATVLFAAFILSGVLQWAAAASSHQARDSEPWWTHTATPSAETVAHGRALFLNSCAHCHGEDARGDEGPDLHDLRVSDRYITNTIKRGIKGEMPSFAKKHSEADVAALRSYVRSLPE